ncbi:MAG: Gfo/Idh/MocA family oxidoreductase [Candidatus Omnitrophota bacterium]
MKKLNLVIIGTGMYVCGRGTDGFGTIMPAICQWKKNSNLEFGEVYLAGTSKDGAALAGDKINELKKMMGVEINVRYFPENRAKDAECYKQAIREISKPACAIVAVPDNLHKKIAGEAVKEGLHTLVVKPLAPTLKETLELIDIQRKSGAYCAVEFHKRFDLANLKLKDALEKGSIGDPLYFLVEFSQKKSIPTKIFRKWVETTNIFQYLGVHYVDMIYFVTKAKPKRVMATGQKNWLVSKGIDDYDSIEAVIEWELPNKKTFVSHILTNWIDPEGASAMSDQKIKVIGTKGRFESDQKNRGIMVVTDEKGIEEPNPYFCAAFGSKGEVSYRGYGIESIHQFFKDAIMVERGEVKLEYLEDKRSTFSQSVGPTAVIEAVNESLRKNSRWVGIK